MQAWFFSAALLSGGAGASAPALTASFQATGRKRHTEGESAAAVSARQHRDRKF